MKQSFEWGRFSRHEGMIHPNVQKKIRETTVAIIGVGGIGGAIAMLCAKAGFGQLIICDFDEFESVNIVEQMFAMSDTVGSEKIQAASKELIRHNPDCSILRINKRIESEEDAKEIIKKADYVFSGVDNPISRIYISRAAKSQGVSLFIPSNIGWSVLFSIKESGNSRYDERLRDLLGLKPNSRNLNLNDSKTVETIWMDWNIWIALLSDFDNHTILELFKGKVKSYPYMAFPAFFAASFGVSQLIKYISNNRFVYLYPNIFCFNMKCCKELNWDKFYFFHGELLNSYIKGGYNEVIKCWNSIDRKNIWGEDS